MILARGKHKLSFDNPQGIKDCILNYRKITVKGCWEWTRAKSKGLYGSQFVSGRTVRIHRLSAYIFLGFDIDSEKDVCHKCDNPRCFNPEHLFIGTTKENMIDMTQKGRNYFAKLDKNKVEFIRQAVDNGRSQKSLAEHFKVSRTTINRVVRRERWDHVA